MPKLELTACGALCSSENDICLDRETYDDRIALVFVLIASVVKARVFILDGALPAKADCFTSLK